MYGLGKHVEIGANYGFARAGRHSVSEISPNIKWQAYANEKSKIAISGGAIAFFASGERPSAFLYANASKELGSGLRFTGGVYTTVKSRSATGTRSGVMAG